MFVRVIRWREFFGNRSLINEFLSRLIEPGSELGDELNLTLKGPVSAPDTSERRMSDFADELVDP